MREAPWSATGRIAAQQSAGGHERLGVGSFEHHATAQLHGIDLRRRRRSRASAPPWSRPRVTEKGSTARLVQASAVRARRPCRHSGWRGVSVSQKIAEDRAHRRRFIAGDRSTRSPTARRGWRTLRPTIGRDLWRLPDGGADRALVYHLDPAPCSTPLL